MFEQEAPKWFVRMVLDQEGSNAMLNEQEAPKWPSESVALRRIKRDIHSYAQWAGSPQVTNDMVSQ